MFDADKVIDAGKVFDADKVFVEGKEAIGWETGIPRIPRRPLSGHYRSEYF